MSCFQSVLQSSILCTIPTTRLTALVCVSFTSLTAAAFLHLLLFPSLPCLLSTVLSPKRNKSSAPTGTHSRNVAGPGRTQPPVPPRLVSLNFLLTTRIPYVLYEYCQTLTYATSTPTNSTLPFPPSSFLLPHSSLSRR